MPAHGEMGLSTGYYLINVGFILVAALGVWMMIDTMRAKRRSRKQLENIPREPLMCYALLGGIYAILLLLTFALALANVRQSPAMAVVIGAPVMIALELVYLLRVVYPKSPAHRDGGSSPDAAPEGSSEKPSKQKSSK